MTYSSVVSSGARAAVSKGNVAPTDSSLKMVIIKDHEDQITEEQSQVIQNFLNTAVFEHMKSRPEVLLRFDSFSWKNGIITVTCADDNSKAWLTDKVDSKQGGDDIQAFQDTIYAT